PEPSFFGYGPLHHRCSSDSGRTAQHAGSNQRRAGSIRRLGSGIEPAGRGTRRALGYQHRAILRHFGAERLCESTGCADYPGVRGAEHFNVAGAGIVADIDTGVDPDHPALQGVLLQGWDFTRNQAGGCETTDLQPPFVSPPPCTDCVPATVNQSTAAVLDQSTAAVLAGNPQYAAFGHGTMGLCVLHPV